MVQIAQKEKKGDFLENRKLRDKAIILAGRGKVKGGAQNKSKLIGYRVQREQRYGHFCAYNTVISM